MREAPNVSGKLGENSKLNDDEIEKQLAKLKAI